MYERIITRSGLGVAAAVCFRGSVALLASLVWVACAQGEGIFLRSGCTTLTSSVLGQPFCFDQTQNALMKHDRTGRARINTSDVFINVQDPRFGATGDGTTNDAAAIQAAIDAGGPSAIIFLPKPRAYYNIGTTSLRIRDRQWWLGESRSDAPGSLNEGTTIVYTGTGSAIYGIGKDSNTQTFNMRVSNLRIVGNRAAQVLDMTGWCESLVEFVGISSTNGSGSGILLASAKPGRAGGSAYYNTLWQMTILNSDLNTGILFKQDSYSGMNSNRVIGGKINAKNGVHIDNSGGGTLASDILIQGVAFETSQSANAISIWAQDVVDSTFAFNRYENACTGACSGARDIVFDRNAARNLVLGGHFGSMGGARISDSSSGSNGANSWFAPVYGSGTTQEVRANRFTLVTGTGVGEAHAGGVICNTTTAQATTRTTEETLASCALPANALAVDGQCVRVTTYGDAVGGNRNGKAFAIYFGGTGQSITNGTGGEFYWDGEMVVCRTGASSQKGFVRASFDHATGYRSVHLRSGESLSRAVTIKVTGTTPARAGDLTLQGMMVEYLDR